MADTRLNSTTKIFATLFALGGIIWLGANIARFAVSFDAYVPGTTEFKVGQTDAARIQTIWLFTLLGGWTGWSFAIATLGAIGLAIKTASSWKQHGWLFMSFILFLLVAAGQGWVIWHDIELWGLFDPGTGLPLAQSSEVITVFSQRVTDITSSVINGLTLLSALTIVMFIVWRPLENR